MQWSPVLARSGGGISFCCPLAGALDVEGDNGVQLGVEALDPLEVEVEYLDRTPPASLDIVSQREGAAIKNIGHGNLLTGTRCRGALSMVQLSR